MIDIIMDIIRLLNEGNVIPMQKDQNTKIDLYNDQVQLFVDSSGEENKYYYFAEFAIDDEQDNLAQIEDVVLNSDVYTVIGKPKPSNSYMILLWKVALLAFGGQMGIAKAAVLLIATFVLYQPLENLGNISAMVRMMEVSLKRIEKMKKIPVMEGENQTPLQYDIRFENVSFQYEQNQSDVIHDVSFYIPEKEMTAIVGPSGCGKTTLTRLMARFWDVGSGCVSIGGIDVRKIHPEQLYSYFSIVFQNVFLFHDTIENNIKFGNPAATHEEVVAAAKKACCHDFIQSLPDGYATMVEENGGNLSGGEKQRISIARAILKDAPIILLDEATSSVDPENEWMLQQAIQELTAGKTVVMIAHKIKTIMNAGQIIVMDNGRVHGIGTHEALLQSDEIYRTFWDARRTASQWKI